jgi:hypothetical protein
VSIGPNSDSPKIATAYCPAGKKVTGGGGWPSLFVTPIAGSWPLVNGSGWVAGAVETPPTAENWTLTVYAICVTALP